MTHQAPPRLALRGLTKSFGGVHALDGVDLTVQPGEIHGLLGTNGSGKSTLIKVLSGFHAPDAGTLEIDGARVPLPMPAGQTTTHGLTFVHQNLGLLPDATVLENLLIGDAGRGLHIRWRAEETRAKALFAAHQLDIRPDQRVEDLSPVKRAQLAIVRAADRVARGGAGRAGGLMVLDEPTPFLPQGDVQELFAMMRRLAATGISLIFVSHDIDEVRDITDRATVLRDGKVIATFDTAGTDHAALVKAIVGRSVSSDRSVVPLAAPVPVARVTGLCGQVVRDVDLSVHAGEILGLTGLIGSGYDETVMLLAGARRAEAGQLDMQGRARALPALTPKAAMGAGIALIPADRPRAGIVPDLTLTENATLPVLRPPFALNHRRLRAVTRQILTDFRVKAEGPGQAASELSGGNQQKVVLGKWLQLGPKLLLLDEPTQGIDVGARREILDRIEANAAAGGAIVFATSEFDLLQMVAHRVLVFDRGRIKAELTGDDVTKTNIAEACYKGAEQNAAG